MWWPQPGSILDGVRKGECGKKVASEEGRWAVEMAQRWERLGEC